MENFTIAESMVLSQPNKEGDIIFNEKKESSNFHQSSTRWKGLESLTRFGKWNKLKDFKVSKLAFVINKGTIYPTLGCCAKQIQTFIVITQHYK